MSALLSEQTTEVREQCAELAKLRQCSVEVAWAKSICTASILQTTPIDGLIFCLEASKNRGTTTPLEPWGEPVKPST
jgi:hypothetical protein